ncbi:MAG: four helix bundle protein [Verrucomicrobia bacterium]|nr:MAG: four helix bundle protein [Verrucomicrobiota bacterium]
MNAAELKQRTKQFGIRIVKLVEALPRTPTAGVIGRQLLRSGTSVGANYRAVCRAKSRAGFIAKLGIVEEECDESIYWLEMLVESNLVKPTLISALMKEGEEILAIVVASSKTARVRNNPQSAIANPK